MTKTLSVLIPAYNEERTIQNILEKVKEVELIADLKKEVIVVNDCSGDSTAEVVEAYIK